MPVEKDQYSTDELADKYHVFLKSRESELRYVQIPSIYKLLNYSLKGKRVIDLACGHGGSTRILADLEPDELVGVDLSAEQVKKAVELSASNKKYALIKYYVRDCSKPLELGQFDVVFSKHLLNYGTTKEVLNGITKSMFDATKPGQLCAGLMFNPAFEEKNYEIVEKYGLDMKKTNEIEIVFKLHEGNVKTTRYLMDLHIFMWPPSVFEEAFAKAGFKEFEWVKTHLEEDPDGKHLFHKDLVDYEVLTLFRAVRPANNS